MCHTLCYEHNMDKQRFNRSGSMSIPLKTPLYFSSCYRSLSRGEGGYRFRQFNNEKKETTEGVIKPAK